MNVTEEADKDELNTSTEDAISNAIFNSKKKQSTLKVDSGESNLGDGLNFDNKGGVAHVNRQSLV